MKAKPAMDPHAAFTDANHQPGDAELTTALGRAAAPIEKVIANLRAAHPEVTTDWQFSERSGWYQLVLLKKRRLLYLVPKQRDCRVMLILGRRAVARLKQGPFARSTSVLLKTAKHYPEGIAFSFDRKSLDPDLLAAFLAAKLVH